MRVLDLSFFRSSFTWYGVMLISHAAADRQDKQRDAVCLVTAMCR